VTLFNVRGFEMKRLYLWFLVLFVTFYPGCENSISPIDNLPFDLPAPNESAISDSLKNLYQEDGDRLAVRYLFSQGSSDTASVEIPEQLSSLFYKGLIYIYNFQSLNFSPASGLVSRIHTFPYPNLNSLIVSVDTSESWTIAWQNRNITTGNTQIDKLLSPYNFQVSSFSYSWAVLKTNINLNLLALASELEKIPGVNYAEPNNYSGSSYDITATIAPDKIVITYYYGWGDCPAGCISRHYWEYYVMSDGFVQLNREYGTPMQ
jgi:hypothetical protein